MSLFRLFIFNVIVLILAACSSAVPDQYDPTEVAPTESAGLMVNQKQEPVPSRFRTRRFAANGPVTAGLVQPGDVPGWILGMDADHTTNSGDGTHITVVQDLSPSGSNGVEFSAAHGPTYQTGIWGGLACMRIHSGEGLKFTGTALVNAISGQNKPFTIFFVVLPLTALNVDLFGFGNSGTSARQTFSLDGTQRYKFTVVPTSGSTVTATQTQFSAYRAPQVVTLTRDNTGSMRMRIDGVEDTGNPLNLAANSSVINRLVVGGSGAGSSLTGIFCMREMHVYDHVLTLQQITDLEHTFGVNSQLYKQALNVYSNPMVLLVAAGQSNGLGEGTTPYVPPTDNHIWQYNISGWWKQNPIDPIVQTANFQPYSQNMNALTGWLRMLADMLRQGGYPYDIGILQSCIGGTDATQWTTGLSTVPPPQNQLVGIMKLRLNDALKRGNIAKVIFIENQGEANSQTLLEAQNWNPLWDSWFTQITADYGAYLHTGPKKFVDQRMRNQAPAGGVGFAFWSDMLTSKDLLVSTTRTDLVQANFPPGGPMDVLDEHIETGVVGPPPTGLFYLARQTADQILANMP